MKKRRDYSLRPKRLRSEANKGRARMLNVSICDDRGAPIQYVLADLGDYIDNITSDDMQAMAFAAKGAAHRHVNAIRRRQRAAARAKASPSEARPSLEPTDPASPRDGGGTA